MATIKDVAEKAGVSVATVSRVINNGPKVSEKNRQKVREVMQELGYRPNANARALVNRSNPTMGLVISELTDPFFASLAAGVEDVCRERGVQLLISTGRVDADSERRAIETLLEQRCQSLVLHSKALSDEELINYASQHPGIVLINRHIPSLDHRCVWLDNASGGALSAQHLLDLGHRQIAYITSSYKIEDPDLRKAGFYQVAEQHGVPQSDILLEVDDPNEIGGERATQNLLARGRDITAIATYNDAMAAGVIAVLSDNGIRVPEDISVIGFDDVLLSRYIRPKLTTMRYPIHMMAAEAARLAFALADGNAPEQSHKYNPTLVKRSSVTHCNR